MSTYGKENWLKHWKGNDGITVTLKKSTPYYLNPTTNKLEGTLSSAQNVVYRDSYSQHIDLGGSTKIGFQFDIGDKNVYYAKVDNFRKPGVNYGISLNPQSFGLDNKTFSSVSIYTQAVKRAIDARWQSEKLSGELYDYLMELVNFADGKTIKLTDIDTSDFDWGEIQKSFGEVIGPIAAIKNSSLMSRYVSGISNASITIPASNQPLYDYILEYNSKKYSISAKAGKGVTNQVKPQFVIPYINNPDLKSSVAYNLLEIIARNPDEDDPQHIATKQGPFYAWEMLERRLNKSKTISGLCINDVIVNYGRGKSSKDVIKDPSIWVNFIKKYMPEYLPESKIKNVTYGQLRYKCEKLIEDEAKRGKLNTDLKLIFEEYLNVSRVIYIKLTINRGNPSFTSINIDGVSKVNSISFRSSNDSQNRIKDRMGYDQVS